jgi:hypothetical protein
MKRINPLLTGNNPAPIPGCHAPVKQEEAFLLENALETWLWEDKVLSTTDCQQGLLPTYPTDVMSETKVSKTTLSLPHCHPAFVPAR